MAYNDKRLKTDLEGKPIPQAYNPDIDDYEPVHSTNNALNQVIYGPNGQPISTVGNKLAVRATELEALMQGLATEGKLEQVRQLLAGVATEAVVIGLLADRPPASEMRGRGYYAWDETDGHKLKYSDGTDWVVNQ